MRSAIAVALLLAVGCHQASSHLIRSEPGGAGGVAKSELSPPPLEAAAVPSAELSDRPVVGTELDFSQRPDVRQMSKLQLQDEASLVDSLRPRWAIIAGPTTAGAGLV